MCLTLRNTSELQCYELDYRKGLEIFVMYMHSFKVKLHISLFVVDL